MSEISSGFSITSKNSGNHNRFPGINGQSLDTDQLFMQVIQHGDYSAFQKLFMKMYNPLCQFCVKFVQVREVAEELVSDVFYTIWKNRERIDVTSPRSYLFAAVRNRSFDHLRKGKRSMMVNLEEATDIAGYGTNSQDAMIESELSETIERSVSALPKQCRLIFELSRDHGLKYREIATELKISIKTVETQMGRALRHLRQTLPST